MTCVSEIEREREREPPLGSNRVTCVSMHEHGQFTRDSTTKEMTLFPEQLLPPSSSTFIDYQGAMSPVLSYFPVAVIRHMTRQHIEQFIGLQGQSS